MAATALALPAPSSPSTPRSLARRSRRFLSSSSAAAAMGGSCCSAEVPCPDIIEPINGFPFPGAECGGGVCVDTSFDAQHCGGCEPQWYSCGSWPWICCYGYCFNSQNDPENCGVSCDGDCDHGVCDYAV